MVYSLLESIIERGLPIWRKRKHFQIDTKKFSVFKRCPWIIRNAIWVMVALLKNRKLINLYFIRA